MRIARRFLEDIVSNCGLSQVKHLQIALQGSLALTGVGHATPKAVILGLLGKEPETLAPDLADTWVDEVRRTCSISLMGTHSIPFDPDQDIRFDFDTIPELHPNCMHLAAIGESGSSLAEATYYSTGGGFIASAVQLQRKPSSDTITGPTSEVPCHFSTGAELLSHCSRRQETIDQVILANENAMRPIEQTMAMLDHVSEVMMACIDRGLNSDGILPGGLNVKRRAPGIWNRLQQAPLANEREELFDWLNVYAMAVNEENAAGGQVVTAPTNGAAGIIPSVLRHYCSDREDCQSAKRKFLLTAGGIGLLYKMRASISGAEMGCQGEVGVACSMAAGGLAAVWGGSPDQIASAAEIGMEHNLGLTCDPVGGLVQIPCIERNALGAVKAVNAARLAVTGTVKPRVSLDQVIETMRQTGIDMSDKYKETSRGGLAVNVVEC
jgi:L-serine dehydratase